MYSDGTGRESMNRHKPVNSIWSRSREEGSFFSHFRMVIFLSLVYFIVLILFISRIETFPYSDFFSLGGMKAAFLVFVLIVVAVYAIVNLVALLFCGIAKSMRGSSTFFQTKDVLMRNLVTSLPIGGFFLLIQSTIRHDLSNPIWVILKIIAYLGFLSFSIYSFVVFLKAFAKVNQFGLWRSLSVFCLGNVFMASLIYAFVLFR